MNRRVKRGISLLAAGALLVLLSCASTPARQAGRAEHLTGTAFLAQDPAQFERLGIRQGAPEAWEDGMRTDGREGSYEWWYTDARLEDGMTVVVVFFSKRGFDVAGPAHPTVSLDITYADGKKLSRVVQLPASTTIASSKDRCNVAVGESYLRAADAGYELRFLDKDLRFEAQMTSTLPMWRPATGHWYFGEQAKDYFAWFVAQPASTVEATLSVGGDLTQLSGIGYHDHNWGNIPMNTELNHWYWGRARVGDYTVIACDLVAEKAYGYTRLPVIMIARGGAIITDDQNKTIVTRSNTHPHPVTGKFMDDTLTYTQAMDDGEEYRIVFDRRRDIVATSLLAQLPPFQRFVARILGNNPTYVRILGDVTLSVHSNGGETSIRDQGLWEQMFFGGNREAVINDPRNNSSGR